MAVSSLSEKVLIKNSNSSIIADSSGNSRGPKSIDLQQFRGASNQVAAGHLSSILGGGSNKCEASYSAIVGGALNNTSADKYYSSIVGGVANSISSSYGGILGGYGNTVAGNYGTIMGGSHNTASGHRSSILGGDGNITSSNYATVLNGTYNSATGFGSLVWGRDSVAAADFSHAFGASASTRYYGQKAVSSGNFSDLLGSAQASTFTLLAITSNATPTLLTANSFTATSISVEVNRFMAFTVTILGVKTNGGDTVQFTRKGVVSNVGGTTALVGSIQTLGTDIATGGAGTWAVAITANNTTDRVDITVTGQAATTIRWFAKVEAVEILIA